MWDLSTTASVLRGTLPTLLGSVVVGLWLARPLGRRLGVPTWHAAWLATSTVGFLALTLLPGWLGTGFGSWIADHRLCEFAWSLHLSEVVAVPHEWLNALVLVPLGGAVALLPTRWRRRGIVGAALLSPLVEVVQAVVPRLSRVCAVDDVVLNVGGLLVGLALGAGVAAMAPGLRAAD